MSFEENTYGSTMIVVPDAYEHMATIREMAQDQFGRTFASLVKDGARTVKEIEWVEFDCDGAVCGAVSPPPDFAPHKHVGWEAVIA